MVERLPVKKMVGGSSPPGGAMKKMAHFLIQKYSQMSGDKKVRIALEMSKQVRRLIKLSIINTKTTNSRVKYLVGLD